MFEGHVTAFQPPFSKGLANIRGREMNGLVPQSERAPVNDGQMPGIQFLKRLHRLPHPSLKRQL